MSESWIDTISSYRRTWEVFDCTIDVDVMELVANHTNEVSDNENSAVEGAVADAFRKIWRNANGQ